MTPMASETGPLPAGSGEQPAHGHPAEEPLSGIVSHIQRWSIRDGPGIRTTVFLKGCPLHCLWCHNPELQRASPEMTYDASVCTACGSCLPECPSGATVIASGRVVFRRVLCHACGACALVCVNEARALVGKHLTVDYVLYQVGRDVPFYARSGGGMTVSGGEPLAQPGFTQALLQGARERGLHTALDTCGYAPPEVLAGVASHADLVLYDLKGMAQGMHRRLTGVGQQLILSNLRTLLGRGAQVWIRIPVVRDLTDSPDSFEAIARLLLSAGRPQRIELLAYHEYGVSKYAQLGRRYRLTADAVPSKSRMEQAKSILERTGAPVFIRT